MFILSIPVPPPLNTHIRTRIHMHTHTGQAEGHQQTYRRISRVDIKFPDAVPEDARDLITKLLVKEPNGRMALGEIINHKWIKRCLPDLQAKDAK